MIGILVWTIITGIRNKKHKSERTEFTAGSNQSPCSNITLVLIFMFERIIIIVVICLDPYLDSSIQVTIVLVTQVLIFFTTLLCPLYQDHKSRAVNTIARFISCLLFANSLIIELKTNLFIYHLTNTLIIVSLLILIAASVVLSLREAVKLYHTIMATK